VTGEALSYINWANGEPNNQGGLEKCVEYDRLLSMGWNDIRCELQFFGLCEHNLGQCVGPQPQLSTCVDGTWVIRVDQTYSTDKDIIIDGKNQTIINLLKQKIIYVFFRFFVSLIHW